MQKYYINSFNKIREIWGCILEALMKKFVYTSVILVRRNLRVYFLCWTENLALQQPSWQSTTAWPHIGADRAVDGQYTDQRWTGGQCAVTDNLQTTAEWRVDLGDVRNIIYMVIQFVTDNNVWGTVSGNIFVQTR